MDAPIGFADPQCAECEGEGVKIIIVDAYEIGHGCDGTEEDCIRTCPVPIPTQQQEQALCDCLREFPYEERAE